MRPDASLIQEAATALLCAGHGGKRRLAEQYATAWQCSVQTVYRHVAPVLGQVRTRKRRADRGESAWTLDELQLVSAALLESRRGTGKRLSSIADAIDMLRGNGLIRGESVDMATGEVRLLSESSAAKALRAQRLHPEQLAAPTPKVQLASEHPNQVWQIDPSLCVLYYLRRQDGLHVMPQAEFYKNKPKNLARIEHDRVWRYVVTDHASGTLYVEYVLGAESGENLCNCFVNAMQYRGAADPFCGAPQMVMVDPGSANTGAMFKNLCAALGIKVWINKPGQPWAKGQVEKTNDIVERHFEHRLRYAQPASLEALNEAAWRWMRHFNATAQHSRHKSSRYQAWMTITPEQLRKVPAREVLLRLATQAPETRKVNSLLRISFRGRYYDVSGVPGVIVNEKLTVTRNAFGGEHDAQVLYTGEDGRDTWYTLEPLEADAYGFVGAVPMGSFRAQADTPVDANRKQVERLAMDATSDAEAETKRKAKVTPFGGRIDPYASVTQAPEVMHLPRRGHALDVTVPDKVAAVPKSQMPPTRIEPAQPLGHVELAQRLRERLPDWSAQHYAALVQGWPQGATEDELDAIARRLPLLVQQRRASA